MLNLKFPPKVKFICGFIYREERIYLMTKKIMERRFGEVDFESDIIKFDFTDYYFKELGFDLVRRFICFKRLRDPRSFIKVKLYCIALEKKLALQGRRRINIDPGYLNSAKLVLFTTKNFYHRIYLGRGIYAEVTLHYTKNNFIDFPWTYPDYRTEKYKNIFCKIRGIYTSQIKKR
jgi:hypothetical protein